MSQAANAKKRRRVAPPARLAWPSVSLSSSSPPLDEPGWTANASQSESASNYNARRVTFQQQEAPGLWSEKYTPSVSDNLAVAPKKVKEIAAWMQAPHSKLLVLVGKPGIGKSTAIRLLSNEMGMQIHEWNEAVASFEEQSRSLLEQVGPIASFEHFLQQVAPGYTSLIPQTLAPDSKRRKLSVEMSQGAISSSRSLLLLDDLPNLVGSEAQLKFRQIMQQFMRTTTIPTILIYSNVVEGKHRPEDLERLIDKSHLYSPAMTTILQMHPPTSTRTRKVLESIVKKERLALSSTSSDAFYEELYTKSGGDLRFAIMTLQFQQNRLARSQDKRSANAASLASGRDEKLASFHALGKLLYAKRKVDSEFQSNCSSHRPLLDFDPEHVIDQCDMELGGALSFLQYHSVTFFQDQSDIAGALGCFSDAAFLLERFGFKGRQAESIFPHAYVGSLASRAVANYNHHPAQGKFRQFSAPKIFEVIRKRNANEQANRELMFRLSLSSNDMAISTVLSQSNFNSDSISLVKRILPSSLPAMENFGTAKTQQEREQVVQSELMREQEKVLELDDIIEYDSGDERKNSNGPDKDTRQLQKQELEISTSRWQEENKPN